MRKLLVPLTLLSYACGSSEGQGKTQPSTDSDSTEQDSTHTTTSDDPPTGSTTDTGESWCGEDGFEPNDAPNEASALEGGTTPNLWMNSDSPDYWTFTLGPNDSVELSIEFPNGELPYGLVDLDLYVYDDPAASSPAYVSDQQGSSYEAVDVLNTTSDTVTYHAVVFVYEPAPSCIPYDMMAVFGRF